MGIDMRQRNIQVHGVLKKIIIPLNASRKETEEKIHALGETLLMNPRYILQLFEDISNFHISLTRLF